jgi:thiosulfate/3-mercaptopyruvate sulfurtransferase
MVFLLFLVFLSTNLIASNLRIEINDLVKVTQKYKIIDVRNSQNYSTSHIKGAINFPASLTYHNLSINGKITEPNKMQSIIQSLGIDINDNIVIYDDGTFFDASRVFWALEVYGFKNVKLLNGGFDSWKQLNYETSNEQPKINKSNYIATIDNQKLATKFTTQIATRNNSQIIIDARDYKSYIGQESAAKRFGHIPNAINISAYENLRRIDNNSKLKSFDELTQIYKNLKRDKKIVIYCSVGKIASTNYFALRELGFNVANYDASWKEWGNDFNLPVVNLSKKD